MGLDKTCWINAKGPLEEREKALLLETDEGRLWVPKSQMGARKKDGDQIVRCEVALWWAEKNGLVAKKGRL